MAKPTSPEIDSFGPPTKPFGRTDKKFEDHHKEAHFTYTEFEDKIYDAENDGIPHYPETVTHLPTTDLNKLKDLLAANETKIKYCYLWVLDVTGIKILYEGTPNLLDEESKLVKHTNITGGKEAFHGGELFFSKDKKLFVNNHSDRYGKATDQHWQAVIAYFTKTYTEFSIVDLKKEL